MTDTYKKFTELISWIKRNGGTITDTTIFKCAAQERGVFSAKRIKGNKSIIRIPRSLIIHDGMGQDSYYGRQLLRASHSDINNLQISLVVIFMLEDMRNGRHFIPYYNILPEQFGNFPIFWDNKVLTLLKGSDMLNKIKQRTQSFVNDYKVIARCCGGFQEEYSFKEFLFLRLLVGSRNFGIRIDGIKRVAMIPFSDMLNHAAEPNTNWHYDNNRSQFIMKVNNTIPIHSELTDTYGNKCNSQMLLFYGFALPENKYNQLSISLSQRGRRTRSEQKKVSLYCELRGKLRKGFKDLFAHDMLTFLRISAANDSELNRFKYRRDYNRPITIRNEVEMLNLLHNYMTTLTENYILDLKKITNIISDIDKNSQEYLVLLLIQGELKIIQFYIDFSVYIIPFLKRREIPPKNKYIEYTNKLYSIRQTILAGEHDRCI